MSDEAEPNKVEVPSHYVRRRHAMAVRGEFGGIYEDYYLHLMQLGIRHEAEHDAMLKDALASLTLHLTSRPWDEMSAWTMNFRDPPLNLFVTGDSRAGNVVGRVFTQDVKTGDVNMFFAQVTHPLEPLRESTVEVEGRDILGLVEQYYQQSEQLPARLFRLGGDEYAMVVAQPDIDMKWFEALDAEAVRRLERDEELGLLERRFYHFGCGCNLATILKVLVKAYGKDPGFIFGDQRELEARCPRCAGVFYFDRPALERFIESLDARPSEG